MGVQSMKLDVALPVLLVGWLEWYRGKIAWRWYDERVGKKRRRSCRTTDVDIAANLATKWGIDYKADLKNFNPEQSASEESITLGDAALGYLREAALRLEPRSYATNEQHLLYWGRVIETLGSKTPLSNIRPQHIVQLQEALMAADMKPQTINKITGTLNQVFDWAMRNEFIERRPQWRNLSVQHKEHRRELTPFEVLRILAAAWEKREDPVQGHLWPFVLLLAGSGMRRSEPLRARWEDVNWKDGLVRMDRQKNKTAMPAPVDEWALDELKKIKQRSGFIVQYKGHPVGDVKSAWRNLVKRAKVDASITCHYFRHWFVNEKMRLYDYDSRFFTRHTSAQGLAAYLHHRGRELVKRKVG